MTNNLDASNMNKVRLRNMETNFEHLHKGWTSLSHVLQRTVLSSCTPCSLDADNSEISAKDHEHTLKRSKV